MADLDPARVDQIVAGAVLVDYLVAALEATTVRISPNALREGMVFEYLETHGDRLRRLGPTQTARGRQALDVGLRVDFDEAHGRQVAGFAVQLFDVCAPLHGYDGGTRELLEYAALLHDVGRVVQRRRHHKHSRYLIEQAEWIGFAPDEVSVMANVARYHRGAAPSKKHRRYAALPRRRRRMVRRLAAILRLADGLDRSHYQNVVEMKATLDESALTILVTTRGEPQLELWGVRGGASLFEAAFGVPVIVEAAWQAPSGST
jgi:exopolyphosphatase/guanosine-5'-triphosphate,3'-diphosphate pyrophosphatase